jgi:hypothetical protein
MSLLVVHITFAFTAEFHSYKLPENLITSLSMTLFTDCEAL